MTAFFQPIKLSLIVSLIALIIVIVLGMAIAWLMAKKNFRGKVWIETFLLLPIVLPPTVIGFLLIMLFGQNGFFGKVSQLFFGQSLIFSIWAAVIAAVIVAFPLMYQSVKTGISFVDQHVEDAARVDGANEWKVFSFITLPLIKKSLVSGVVLSFARALGEFGATLMFAGNIPGRTQTVPMAIYVAFESNKMALAWGWVLSIIVISFVMLLFLRNSA
ncbi:molybdate ABC transporter permease subunit [Gracilibacillus caseinilyticus]|uniref:Molybdenum transport system permease n=1 Tax=Gracilibacillus caseinilyticus TaxID=2932256 RepID=A0ABY4EZA6_9BACI|nr:molybdate ABC transporter permease subunit [Gracilibacillus caseinilyticus]UOQ48974.1 molybdate ABC transporter permease subunit [Gracilibacillus caseinilyticus]